jgi:hypothetical protein
MIRINKTFSHISNLEQVLSAAHNRWVILGREHEAIRECCSLVSDSDELEFGLGVAIASTAIEPKAIHARGSHRTFVGFDSYIAMVAIVEDNLIHTVQRLDGAFVDMVLLPRGNICIVHELGAMLMSAEGEKIWSHVTDLISDWSIDVSQGKIELIEADSRARTVLSLSDGRNGR